MTKIRLTKIACIVGARPNFVKMAPILRALDARGGFAPRLIHTGQHYDIEMSQAFFDELNIPQPDINLEVGSGSLTSQSARTMLALEKLFRKKRPAMVLVVGDVNATLASALVAVQLGIPVVHVESGLRSGDRSMPEEINRTITDSLSDLLFTTEEDVARENLLREGIAREKIIFVGNVMIDSLLANLPRARPVRQSLLDAGAQPGFIKSATTLGYGLVTLHRPSNVDDSSKLEKILDTLSTICQRLPIVFPLHPRTRQAIDGANLLSLLENSQLFTMPPIGYLDMLGLMKDAKLVITDSGGVQEETTALGVACLTLRENTERPVTITEGTNTLVDGDPAGLLPLVDDILQFGGKKGRVPALWDGRASQRIVEHIARHLGA